MVGTAMDVLMSTIRWMEDCGGGRHIRGVNGISVGVKRIKRSRDTEFIYADALPRPEEFVES